MSFKEVAFSQRARYARICEILGNCTIVAGSISILSLVLGYLTLWLLTITVTLMIVFIWSKAIGNYELYEAVWIQERRAEQ